VTFNIGLSVDQTTSQRRIQSLQKIVQFNQFEPTFTKPPNHTTPHSTMKRKSDSLQDNNNNQSFQKKINPKKSKKLVNKLLRTATTPSSILAAFRQVYGPHVSANITIENDGKNLAPTSISNMILFCLEGSMKRNTPQWCNIANRPLIQNVAVVMVPSLDPRWLSESPSSFPFLTTLKSRSLRVVSIQSDAVTKCSCNHR
jgi:hypothetical protein